MALYRVLQKSFINGSIAEEGDTVEFDGEAGDNLELVKKGKKGADAPDQQEDTGVFDAPAAEAPAAPVPNGV